MGNQASNFQYTYSAKQQEEVKSIRQKYMPQKENKMEQLRRLDRSVTKPGTVVSLAMGIGGSLVMGVGMCCTMVWTQYFIPGIIIGLFGMTILGLAYPLYLQITKKKREKMAPVIIKLSEELMG